jgi:hypothetical protein
MVTMGWREKLRALIDEPDEVEADEVEADEVEADEVEADEVEADEVEADEVEADEVEADEVEGTPGDESEDTPEVADLRAEVGRLQAENESLRNQVAILGGEVDEVDGTAPVVEAAEEVQSEEYLAAFDSDYAERQAHLAEITKGI